MENTSDNYFSQPPENFSGSENFSQENPVDEFPPKPVIPESPFIMSSIFSLLLFVGAYYLFFDHDLIQIAILVLVLFIHELGHFLAMKYFGYSDVKMFFVPFLGALVTGNKEEISQKQRAIILLAGPIPGIIIGAVLFYFGKESDNQDVFIAAAMFVFLNVLNLIPLNPLDGGRLIETLFFHSKDLLRNIFIGISAVAMVVLAIKFEMYTLLILPAALLMRVNQNKSITQLKDSLSGQGLDYNKPFSTLSNREYWLIRREVVNHMAAFSSVDGNNFTVSPRERQIAEQMKGLAERKVNPDLGTGGVILFTVLWLFFLAVPLVLITLAYIERLAGRM